MTINISIVGCGAIVRNSHLPTLLGDPGFRVTALVDPDLHALRRIKRQFGLEAELLTDTSQPTNADAVLIAAPPHLHAASAISALKEGKHVLCEKPIATTNADAQSMIEAAQKYQRTLLIGIQKYYCPNNKVVSDIIDHGFIGALQSAELICAYKAQWDAANANRFNPEVVPGGVLFESGIHWIYRIISWLGPLNIKSYQDDRIDGVEANAAIECTADRLEPPVPIRMYFSWDHALESKLILRGKKGICEIRDGDRFNAYVRMKLNHSEKLMQIAESTEPIQNTLYASQLAKFAQYIQNEAVLPEPTLLARQALGFILDCYQNRKRLPQPWVTYSGSRTE